MNLNLQELQDRGKARCQQLQRFLQQLSTTVQMLQQRHKQDHQQILIYYQKSISDLETQYEQIATNEITTLNQSLTKAQAIRAGYDQIRIKKTQNKSLLNSFRQMMVGDQQRLMKEIDQQGDRLQGEEGEFREVREHGVKGRQLREVHGVQVDLLEENNMMVIRVNGKEFVFRYDSEAKKWKSRDTQAILNRAINQFNIHKDLSYLVTTLRHICQPHNTI